MDHYREILQQRGVRVTAVRLLILRAMYGYARAFSIADLEEELDTIDKSTLSRTIHLFHDKLLIHSIDDGTGSVKYSLCHTDCGCEPEELHVHFHCIGCKVTYCMESIPVPHVELPEKFVLESANFVLKGYCDKCRKCDGCDKCKFAT